MSATAIRTALVTAMTELSGSGQVLKSVYDYPEMSPRQYPCALVLYDGMKGKTRLDSHSDFLIHGFTIRVLLQAKTEEDDSGEDEDQIVSLSDAVINKFMASGNIDTLSGVCDRFDITSAPIRSENTEMPLRGIDFTIEAAKRILIA